MNIKISKKQWEEIGKKAGWTKTAMQQLPEAEVWVSELRDAKNVSDTVPRVEVVIGNYTSVPILLTTLFTNQSEAMEIAQILRSRGLG